MTYLQGLRVAIAIAVVATGGLVLDLDAEDLATLISATAGYVLIGAVAEALRRSGTGRRLWIAATMLLVDGLYLAGALYATGGSRSPLIVLVYLHLIAVTLLASYRTGLKIALWHSLLYFVSFYAQVADIIPLKENRERFEDMSLFNVSAFWLVAIATAAFSALNERELRRRKVDLEALAAASAAMDEAAHPEGIAHELLDRLCTTFELSRGVVLAGPSADDMKLLAYRGPGEPHEFGERSDAAIKRAWLEHKTLLLKRLDPEMDKGLGMQLPFARNIVVVPMFADSAPVGAVVLERGGSVGRIERHVVAMAEQFVSHATLALRNAWLLAEVRRMAETDSLTGIANRRTFEDTLSRELARAERNGEPLTLMMMDLDRFKEFNDAHGHQAGDKALRLAATALMQRSRDFDTVSRYGGEEFAVILPACSSRESLPTAERLRRSVGEIASPESMTASAGVATYPTHALSLETLIKAADEALYESKRAGRDRVTRSRRRPRARVQADAQLDPPRLVE